MIKIALLVASMGYQPMEYNVPLNFLKENGIQVITASDKPGTAKSSHLGTTSVDMTIDQLNPQELDGLFLVGGPGALHYLNNKKVHTLLQTMQKLKKPIGAICISPRILATSGVLNNKNATGWNDDQKLPDIFKQHHVNFMQKDVVVDGNIVTANGPLAAQEFAQEILKILKKK